MEAYCPTSAGFAASEEPPRLLLQSGLTLGLFKVIFGLVAFAFTLWTPVAAAQSSPPITAAQKPIWCAYNSNSTSATCAYSSSNTQGDILFAFQVCQSTTGTIGIPTDTAGNSWLPVNPALVNSGDSTTSQVFYVQSAKRGANTVTYSSSKKTFCALLIWELTNGIAGTWELDQTQYNLNSGTNNSTLTSNATQILSQPNELVIGVGGEGGGPNNTFTAGTGYTIPSGGVSEVSTVSYAVESLQSSSIAAETATMAMGSNGNWEMYLATFVPPPATGTPIITSLSPNGGPVGTVVTINGNNFGSSQAGSTVKFNGVAATPITWSNGSIQVAVPSGAATGYVAVTVAGSASNGVKFGVEGPIVSAQNPVWCSYNSNAESGNCAYRASNSAGNILFGFEVCQSTTATLETPTDTAGNSWLSVKTALVNKSDTTTSQLFYVQDAKVGPNIVTYSSSKKASCGFLIWELTNGVAGSWKLDQVSSADDSGTNTTALNSGATGTLAQPNELVIGLGGSGFGPGYNFAAGTGFRIDGDGASEVPAVAYAVEWLSSSSTSPQTATMTISPASDWEMYAATFEPPPVPVTITSISPGADPVGAVVTINGASFGSSQGQSTITFGGVSASPTQWSNIQITVPVPAAAVGSDPVVVTTTQGASNSEPFTVVASSAPLTIVASGSPAPNAYGWNNTSVTISYQCSGGVPPVQCPGSKTVTTQGANQAVTATAVDADGNTATVTTLVSIDLTPPTITATALPAPDASGWNNTPVTVTFICADSLSGIATCPTPQTISTQGANQVIAGTAVNKAGSSATASVTLNIGTAPPAITASTSPAPNASGWNNIPVTITFTCTAGTAPIAICPPPQTVLTQGQNQAISGTVTDVAGNKASTSVNVSIETTPPSITASVSPSPTSRGWNNSPVTVNFVCAPSVSAIAQCPSPQTVSAQGANQIISGTVTDSAGYSNTTQATVNISTTPPTILASVSPAPNGNGWLNTAPIVSFVCNGPVAPIASCPSPQQVTKTGANQVVSGTVADYAGATATASVLLNIDTTPPVLNVTSPPSGSNFNTQQTPVQGLVSDAISGVQSVTCGGATATLTGGTFSCNVSLLTGSNSIVISATNVAGNTTTSNLTLLYVTPINVQITTPTPLQLFSSSPLTVTGSVGDPNATVTVGGVIATLNGTSFSAAGVVLQEGTNLLTASATDTASGGIGSDSVSVILDTTPPVVQINSPITGAVVTSPQIDVTGGVNDMVTGTVNGDQVSVVVNGVSATVANRSFAAHGVLLVPGQNTITAVATDRAGNTDTNQVQVTLQQVAGQTLSIVSGNDQSGVINTLLPQPLVVMAANALGQPMPNVALNFSVLKSDGFMISGQQQGRQLTIQTGANGQASVQLQLGRRNGAGINQVSVSAPGFVGQAVFSEDSTVGATAVIHTVSGEWQMGAAGVALAQPLVAIVFDAGGNPVVNVPVTFTVQSGGGLIGGGTTFVTNSDSDGKAYAVLVLGQQEGINNNAVTASFPGMAGEPASFISSGVVPGPAANTIVSGLVLDDTDAPIPNATASIQGTNLSALTNAQGQFTIANAPVGDIVLYINGATSTSPYTFPTLSFQMATIPGVNNTLGHPVYLPALDTSNSQVVGGDQPVQLTMTGVPGLVYTVAPNSVTFPDGSHVGTLTLSQVHGDRVPMAPPNGTAPRLVGTLQPAGVLFNPPIQMQLPNTDGLAPGQVEEIFSFHHDLEQFVVEGTARVSQDGSVVVTDPGFGLTVSGWHGGGGNNQNPTCGDGCGACQACSNGSCQADATQNGQTCTTPDGCTVGTCSSGSCNGNPTSVSNFTVFALDQSGNQQTSLSEIVAQSTTTATVTFVSQITSNCTNGVQYTWDFGDGNAGSGSSLPPSHMYTAGQTYNATFSATCNGCPNSPAMNATVIVTIAQIQLNYVQFEGNKRSIMKDGQTLTSSCQPVTGGRQILPVVTPEWQAACGATNGTPGTGAPVQEYVAYTQGNNVTVKVDFVVTPSLSTPIPNVYLQGQASYAQIAFMQSGLSISGTDFSVDNLIATSALPGEVDYESAFTITWSISTDGQNYTTVGMSQNPLYVLLNDADPTNPDANILTAIYLAASEGNAQEADTAVDNTWTLFSNGSGPANVTTWDGFTLAYYPPGQPSTFCATSAIPLVSGSMAGSGQCGSFAALFDAALSANGISATRIAISAKPNPISGLGFLVKNWTPLTSTLSPPPPLQNFTYELFLRDESNTVGTPPCGPLTTETSLGTVPPCPGNVYGEVQRGSGLAGQNSPTPAESAFGYHFIAEYIDADGTGSYYDPSYGVIYDSTDDFEDHSVAGYWVFSSSDGIGAFEPATGADNITFTATPWYH
jgi:hypothetical protein